MAFEGDLKEMSLADVMQTLQTNQKSGLLTVNPEGGKVSWRVGLLQGMIAAVSREGSPALGPADVLVRWGWVDEAIAENALKRWQRAKKKTLGRILVEVEGLAKVDYQALMTRLVEEEVMQLLGQEKATYSFTEGDPDWESFDPEQIWAELRLPIGPLVLEAARRIDEWERIRRNVTSEEDVFLAIVATEEIDFADDIQAEVHALLNGEATISDLLELLPYTRFEIFKALSDLVEEGWVRLAGPEELCELAEIDLEAGDGERAAVRLRGALKVHGHDTNLRLRLADILEELDQVKEAVGELAQVAADLETDGKGEEASLIMVRAIDLRPSDPSLRARALLLSLKHGEPWETKILGVELAQLYVSMGLADQARKVLARLLKEPEFSRDEEILLELAEVETMAGNLEQALVILSRMANLARKSGREDRAVELYEKLLKLVPDNEEAQKALTAIKHGVHARRKHQLRRQIKCVVWTMLGTLAFVYLVHEVAGRVSLARFHKFALAEASWGRPATAISQAQVVMAAHPFTVTRIEADKAQNYLARLQLALARDKVLQKKTGEAGIAMVLLNDHAKGLVFREEWWDLVGLVINQAILEDLSQREKRMVHWALRRITGLRKNDFRDWRLWWIKSGSAFLPAKEKSQINHPRAFTAPPGR